MFGKRIELFRLFGFSIAIDLSWFLIAVLVAWTLAIGYFPFLCPGLSAATYWWMAIVGTLGLFGSIVLHELGHALVARRNGIEMRGITLFVFGGVAEMDDDPPSPGAEAQMAIAGPVVSLLLAGVFFAAERIGIRAQWALPVLGVLHYLWLINGILLLFNLVPAFPLDGGRVLRALLWQWNGNLRRATRITSTIGSAFGIALIGLGIALFVTGNFISGIWWVLIGMFLRSAASLSYEQLLLRQTFAGEKVRRFMHRQPTTVPASATVSQLVDQYIYKHHHKMFPVVSNGHVLGSISTRQVKTIPRDEWEQHTVQELAVPCSGENTVSPDTEAMEALAKMHRIGVSRLLVLDQAGRLEGVVTLKDFFHHLSVKMDLEEDFVSDEPRNINSLSPLR